MKKILVPAFAAILLLAGWHTPAASAATPSGPDMRYGAKSDDDGDADDDDSKAKGKKKKDKKDKKAKKGKKDKRAAAGPAGKAFKKVKFFNGKPNAKARYFIYLQASGEEESCSSIMSDVVEQYAAMKKDGRVEIIYVGHEANASTAKDFLHKHHAKFGGLLVKDQGAQSLLGFAESTDVPNVIIVNAEGEVVEKGTADLITSGKWKTLTIDKDDEESSDDEGKDEE